MTDREDTTMHGMQPAASDPVIDLAVTETKRDELRARDNAVLA